MTDRRRSIYNFNHISETLSDLEISELKNIYKFYRKQYTCYKWMLKN